MSYLIKIVTIIVLFSIGFCAFSITVVAPKVNRKPTAEEIKIAKLRNSVKAKYDKKLVERKLTEWLKQIKNGIDDKPLSAMRYMVYSREAKEWADDEYIELDTGYSKRTFMGFYKLLDYMGKCKRRITLLKMHKKENTAQYEEIKNKFLQAYDKFKELKNKPFKADSRKVKALRRQRRKKQYLIDRMIKKYEKSQKAKKRKK